MNAPNPERIFRTLTAYQETAALKTAVTLGLFTAIKAGHQTVSALAAHIDCSERGVRILADSLTALAFLKKQGEFYLLTAETALFLDGNSPAYLGNTLDFLCSPTLTNGFDLLTHAVRTGTTALADGGTVAEDHEVWVNFARSMMPMAAPAAESLAKLLAPGDEPLLVLDVAAGHGLYGLRLAKAGPQVEVHAMDWAPVLTVAQENARDLDLADRFIARPGNALQQELGGPYDLILLTNFLHHFSKKSNDAFLKKVADALKPEGRVVVVEFVPNEDRVSPSQPAFFSLVMLATTEAGDAYTLREYEEMSQVAGFSGCQKHDLPRSMNSVIIMKK